MKGITFFSMEEDIKIIIRNRIFVHHRIGLVSAVKRMVFVSEKISY
jgi:hypothetical protein